jgi:hypothetical protein
MLFLGLGLIDSEKGDGIVTIIGENVSYVLCLGEMANTILLGVAHPRLMDEQAEAILEQLGMDLEIALV